jgi:hypothetical protein
MTLAAWLAGWWPIRRGGDAALRAAVAACQQQAARAEAAAQRAVQAALVAQAASQAGGVGDGAWRGLDPDLETLDTRR